LLSYTPPREFVARLDSIFRGRLRIRWSVQKEEWHIEQQVGPRAALPSFGRLLFHDRFIRARDGFAFVMAIKPRETTTCRTCFLKCDVPALRTSEIKCSYCESVKARRGREFGGYWPLSGDTLLNHLLRIDPERDGTRTLISDNDRAQARYQQVAMKDARNHFESAVYDDKYQLFDTPFTGYTGKEFSN
jgi:hypothetical protein